MRFYLAQDGSYQPYHQRAGAESEIDVGQEIVEQFTGDEIQMLEDWAASDNQIQALDSPEKIALLSKVNDLLDQNEYGDVLDIRYGTPVVDLRESVEHDDPEPEPRSPLEQIES